MKRTLKIAAVALFIMLGSSWRSDLVAQPYPPDQYNQYNDDGEVTYQEFYDELSPHGRWVDHPQHGYIWIPDAGPDFRPYSTDGHWVWTENYEWMWVSDFDWGWAPFHYGRWDHDPYYSWYWVPGYEWSPAWVAWRDGGDYYGWAPIRPGISIGINFNIGSYSPPYDFWCFTPRRYILSSNPYNYYVDRRQNVTIINQTTIINNFSYNRNVFITGPRRSNFEVYTGRITPYRVSTISRPGRTVIRNNNVSVFRPNIRRDDNRRFAPRNVERYDRQGGNNSGRFDRGNNNRPGNNNGRFDRGNNGRREGNVGRTNQPVRQRSGNEVTGRPSREVDRMPGQQPRQQRGNEMNGGRPSREMNQQRIPQQPRQRTGNEVTGRPSREMDRMPGQQPRQQRGNEMNGRPSREMSPQRQSQQPRIGNENTGRPSREMNQPRQQQPSRQMSQPRPQPSREVSQPRQQQAPRQMERRESSSREGNGSANNGRGNGRNRN
jgi:hypothetical protein